MRIFAIDMDLVSSSFLSAVVQGRPGCPTRYGGLLSLTPAGRYTGVGEAMIGGKTSVAAKETCINPRTRILLYPTRSFGTESSPKEYHRVGSPQGQH
jgi:hypothetical protein